MKQKEREILKKTILLLISLCFILCVMAAEESTDSLKEDNPVATIRTSMGDIVIELFAQEAPKTVANFIGLAEGTKEFVDPVSKEKVKRPFYDNLIFHRVIKGFMIQGGCPLGTGRGGPGYVFEDEINFHLPKRGVLAMANRGPDTNGSQFFINLVDTPWLAGKHTVFGRVIKGMDIVDKIGQVPVDPRTHRPVEPVKIISIRTFKTQ